MDQATAELRAEIEERRERLGRDLDALGNKVSPSATMARKREAAGTKVRDLRERVMGSVEDTRSSFRATHSLSVEASTRMRIRDRPPKTNVSRSRVGTMRWSTT